MRNALVLALAAALAACQGPSSGKTGSVTIKGQRVATVGTPAELGTPAPDFTALDAQSRPVSLASLRGRPVLISAVPNLNTNVCSLQTQRFEKELGSLPAEVVVLTVSTNPPGEQKRFCAEHGIDRVRVLSDAARREFGTRYGVFIEERGILARSIFVVGRDGVLRYKQVVAETSTHPDYDAALEAVRQAAR